MSAALHGGVLFRVDGALFFLPASIAMKLLPIPELATVPGGPVELRGVALVEGDMIPVVEASEEATISERADRARMRQTRGDLPGAMLVCAVLGERVGIVGIEVVATGRFEADATTGELIHGGEVAHSFDVAGIITRVREGRWAV